MMKCTKLMERRMRRKSHVRCGLGEKLEIISKAYLSVFLAKLALDNYVKHSKDFIAEWRYEDVQEKVWGIHPMTEFCGIGHRTVRRLNWLEIRTIREIAEADPYRLKREFGVIGLMLMHGY